MQGFSPFPNKGLEDLSCADLQILKSVSEGWHIEYKREIGNSAAIAKSISSFANTYGGWLFYGVSEDGKTNNTAKGFPGIPQSEMDKSLQRIRQSVAASLAPSPFFETKVLVGPSKEIGLPAAQVVICIRVPSSVEAPHVHANGRIYRRVADGSEPRPETDRHQLDLLWSRRQKVDEDYADWIESEPELSDSERGIAYLRLLLDADPKGLKSQRWDLSVEEIMDTLNDNSSGTTIQIDACYPSSRGIVARQTSSLVRHRNFGLTWILGKCLRSEVWIPLNAHETQGEGFMFALGLEKYKNVERLYQLLTENKADGSRVLDLNQLWFLLNAATTKTFQLLEKNSTPNNRIQAKVCISGVWRTVPFLDSEIILDRIDRFGLPICLDDYATVPRGKTSNSFISVEVDKDIEDPAIRYAIPTLGVMEAACTALGLQVFYVGDPETTQPLLLQLISAGKRSAEPDPTLTD